MVAGIKIHRDEFILRMRHRIGTYRQPETSAPMPSDCHHSSSIAAHRCAGTEIYAVIDAMEQRFGPPRIRSAPRLPNLLTSRVPAWDATPPAEKPHVWRLCSSVDVNAMDVTAANAFMMGCKILLNKIEFENRFDHFASSETTCALCHPHQVPPGKGAVGQLSLVSLVLSRFVQSGQTHLSAPARPSEQSEGKGMGAQRGLTRGFD